jgi:Flp pilus assembly pilin Flp
MTTHRRHSHTLRADHGQTATEYAFILALVVAVVLAVIPLFGGTVLQLFTNFGNAFGG